MILWCVLVLQRTYQLQTHNDQTVSLVLRAVLVATLRTKRVCVEIDAFKCVSAGNNRVPAAFAQCVICWFALKFNVICRCCWLISCIKFCKRFLGTNLRKKTTSDTKLFRRARLLNERLGHHERWQFGTELPHRFLIYLCPQNALKKYFRNF